MLWSPVSNWTQDHVREELPKYSFMVTKNGGQSLKLTNTLPHI